MIMGDLFAVRPYANWRTGGVAIRTKLFFPIFELGLLQFNDDIGSIRVVFFEDHNIGFFSFPAKVDGIFKGQPVFGVAVLLD